MVGRLSHDDRIKGLHALARDLEALIQAIEDYQSWLTPSQLNPSGADVREATLYAAVRRVEGNYRARGLPHHPHNIKGGWDRLLKLNDNRADDHELYEAAAGLVDEAEAELDDAKVKVGGEKSAKRTSKRGPKGPRTDPKKDRLIWDAWKTRRYKTYDKLADEKGITRHDVMRAIDRERKRQSRMDSR